MNELILKVRHEAIGLYLNSLYPLLMKRRVRAVAKKSKIEVVFFAINVAMWRYQGVYDLLSKEERFNCHIVFTVPNTFSIEQKEACIQQLREYFEARNIKYYDYDVAADQGYDVLSKINPDILFYPQPYDKACAEMHEYKHFSTKLLCYIPYSINVVKANFYLYDMEFHNLAWKIFAPTMIEKKNAAKISRNRGCNWVVSGYSNLDMYCNQEINDVWKIKDKKVKRLIWAPHFTLFSDTSWMFSRSSFLWLSEMMLDLAEKYQGRLQIAFKPHPRLKSELYKHSDWGKDRTDHYYDRWANGENTQLETGDFVDLFKTSDAMIHDSGSFTAEYLYVNKPVAFVTTNFEELLADHNEFGQSALNLHYIVKNEQQAKAFIEDVVLGGKDSMLSQRTSFYNEVLRPNVKGSASQFIVDDIKKSLGID